MVNAQAELLMKPAVQALSTGADLPQSWRRLAGWVGPKSPSPPFTLCNLLPLPRSEFWIHPIHHCTAVLGFPLCSKPQLLDCCLMIFSGVRLSNGDCQLASSMNWESGSEPAEAFEHCSYGRWSTNHEYSWIFRIYVDLLESFWVYVTSPTAETQRTTKSIVAYCSICLDLFKRGGFLQVLFSWGVRDD